MKKIIIGTLISIMVIAALFGLGYYHVLHSTSEEAGKLGTQCGLIAHGLVFYSLPAIALFGVVSKLRRGIYE